MNMTIAWSVDLGVLKPNLRHNNIRLRHSALRVRFIYNWYMLIKFIILISIEHAWPLINPLEFHIAHIRSNRYSSEPYGETRTMTIYT